MQLIDDREIPQKTWHAVGDAYAPGRINLIGEHTDYNGGKVLPFAMDLGLNLSLFATEGVVTKAEDSVTFVSSLGQKGVLKIHGDELERLASLVAPRSEDLRPHLAPGLAQSWVRYVVGALAWHQRSLKARGEHLPQPRMQHLQISSDLFIGAGISSSAALSTGILGLMARCDKLQLGLPELARQAMFIEHQFSGTRCGLMDQLAVAMSEKGSLLLIDFKDLKAKDEVTTRSVHPHPSFAAYRPVLINTKVKHELGNSPYNERRQSCEDGLAAIDRALGLDCNSLGHLAANKEFLGDFAPDGQQATLARSLAERIFAQDLTVSRRVAHAIMETGRVDQAVKALEQGDLSGLTTAINASHLSLKDDYEVSCVELDLIREEALASAAQIARHRRLDAPAILGARMTGGGFGGSTIQLVHHSIIADLQEALTRPGSKYHAVTGLLPDVIATQFSPGLRVTINQQRPVL